MEKSASLETIPMLEVKVCLHLPHYIPSYVSVSLFFLVSFSSPLQSESFCTGLYSSSALCLECISTQEQVHALFRIDLRKTSTGFLHYLKGHRNLFSQYEFLYLCYSKLLLRLTFSFCQNHLFLKDVLLDCAVLTL